MIVGTDFSPGALVTAPVAQIGALPDAPLAMPKQRLDRATPPVRRFWAALLRPFFARTRRSGG